MKEPRPRSELLEINQSERAPDDAFDGIENRHGGGVPDVHGLIDKLPFSKSDEIATPQNQSPSGRVATAYWARGGLSFFC
jgi:hypothetical protein